LQNKLSNEQYNPAEDTFFLEDCIKDEKGYSALDIGTGSGYLTKILEKSFSFVIGTDINFDVIKNQTYKTTNAVCCNSADALAIQFDLIICNLPYLATDQIIDIATDGGKEGLEITIPMIKSAFSCIKSGGKFLFVTSSLSSYSKLIDFCKQEGLQARILAKKKLFFEELIIIEAKKLFS